MHVHGVPGRFWKAVWRPHIKLTAARCAVPSWEPPIFAPVLSAHKGGDRARAAQLEEFIGESRGEVGKVPSPTHTHLHKFALAAARSLPHSCAPPSLHGRRTPAAAVPAASGCLYPPSASASACCRPTAPSPQVNTDLGVVAPGSPTAVYSITAVKAVANAFEGNLGATRRRFVHHRCCRRRRRRRRRLRLPVCTSRSSAPALGCSCWVEG